MNKNSIFTSKSPRLDLHGEIADIAEVLILEFLLDNYKEGNEFIAVIHGIGEGVLKERTKEVLTKSNFVKNFYINPVNPGETVIQLSLNN